MKKKFHEGQRVVWNCVEPFSIQQINAVITDVCEDYCIAVTVGNKNPADNELSLMIFPENEMDFV